MNTIIRRVLGTQLVLLAAYGALALGSGNAGSTHIASADTGFFLGPGNSGPASGIVLHGSLVTFHAAAGAHSFTLSWNTIPGSGCDHFEVERSLDGLHFEKMGEVKGLNGTAAEMYSFKDSFHPVTARKYDFYYRLKQVNADGQVSYSKVLIARMYNTKSLASLSVTPDPGANDILVNTQLKENSFVVMKVTDKDGNQVIRRAEKVESGFNTFRIRGTSDLRPGRYMLEVIVNSSERLLMQLEKA